MKVVTMYECKCIILLGKKCAQPKVRNTTLVAAIVITIGTATNLPKKQLETKSRDSKDSARKLFIHNL